MGSNLPPLIWWDQVKQKIFLWNEICNLTNVYLHVCDQFEKAWNVRLTINDRNLWIIFWIERRQRGPCLNLDSFDIDLSVVFLKTNYNDSSIIYSCMEKVGVNNSKRFRVYLGLRSDWFLRKSKVECKNKMNRQRLIPEKHFWGIFSFLKRLYFYIESLSKQFKLFLLEEEVKGNFQKLI